MGSVEGVVVTLPSLWLLGMVVIPGVVLVSIVVTEVFVEVVVTSVVVTSVVVTSPELRDMRQKENAYGTPSIPAASISTICSLRLFRHIYGSSFVGLQHTSHNSTIIIINTFLILFESARIGGAKHSVVITRKMVPQKAHRITHW